MKDNWSRRRFTKAVISAQALISSGAFTLAMACQDTNKAAEQSVLDSTKQETLGYAMDEIIPANEKMPSASEIGGVNYVLEILDDLPELSPLFISLTSKIENQSLALSNMSFSKLESQERIAVLTSLEQSVPELFKVLKDFTYESYYTNKTIHDLIGYEPYPTGTPGPVMEPFDERLLERVKNLPSMYTKI